MALYILFIPICFYFSPHFVQTENIDRLLILNFIFSGILVLAIFYLRNYKIYSILSFIFVVLTFYRLSINIITMKQFLLFFAEGNVIVEIGSYIMGGNFVVGTALFVIATFLIFSTTLKSLVTSKSKWLSYLIKCDAISAFFFVLVNVIYGTDFAIKNGLNMEEAVKASMLFASGAGLAVQIPAFLITVVISLVSSNHLKDELGINCDVGPKAVKTIMITGAAFLMMFVSILSLSIGNALLLTALLVYGAYKLRNKGLLNLNLYIFKELGFKIVKIAKETNRSCDAIVSEALEQWLKNSKDKNEQS